jgi:hypothetical protein
MEALKNAPNGEKALGNREILKIHLYKSAVSCNFSYSIVHYMRRIGKLLSTKSFFTPNWVRADIKSVFLAFKILSLLIWEIEPRGGEFPGGGLRVPTVRPMARAW